MRVNARSGPTAPPCAIVVAMGQAAVRIRLLATRSRAPFERAHLGGLLRCATLTPLVRRIMATRLAHQTVK